jgi:hypothetical protein
MARNKNPIDETLEQLEIRQLIETISNASPRSMKVSWDRKMDNMVSLLSVIKPIEDQILDLMAKKAPILDELDTLRKTMVADCIHPATHLTVHNNIVHCKFCNKSFSVLNHGRKTK